MRTVQAGAVHGRLHVRGEVLQAPHGVAYHAARGGGRLALELDQEEAGEARREAHPGLFYKGKDGAVEKLHGGGVQGEEVGDGVPQRLERPEPERDPGDVGEDRLEPPLDLGNEGEGAFGADQQVELVAGLGERVQGVATGVLAGLRESGVDQPSLVRRQRERIPHPPSRSPRNASNLSLRIDNLDRLDPAPHAAVAQ